MAGLPPVDENEAAGPALSVMSRAKQTSVPASAAAAAGNRTMDQGVFLRVEDVISARDKSAFAGTAAAAAAGGNNKSVFVGLDPTFVAEPGLHPSKTAFSAAPGGGETLIGRGSSSNRFWARRTRAERCLLVTTGLCLLALVGFVVGVALLDQRVGRLQNDLDSARATIDQLRHPSTIQYNNTTMCMTKECVSAASRIQESMDLSEDPCDNFYRFACGRWDQANPPSALNDNWQTLGQMERLLNWNLKEILEDGVPGDPSTMTGRTKIFYNTCLNLPIRGAEATAPLFDILDSMGGFPMIAPLSERAAWPGGNYAFDWQAAVVRMRQLMFADFPFNAYVYLDDLDGTKHVTYVDETSLGLPEYVLLGDPSSQDLYDYQEYMYFAATFMRDARAQLTSNTTSTEDLPGSDALWSAISAVILFETELANITTVTSEKMAMSPAAAYNPFNIKQLQNLTDSVLPAGEVRAKIDWARYFRGMFEPGGVALTPEDKIIVSNPGFLQDLVQLIAGYDDETIANYFMMRFILAVGPETTQRFQTYERTFQKRHHYNPRRRRDRLRTWNLPGSRTEQCISKTNLFLGRSLGAMYVAKYFNEAAKQDLLRMVEQIRDAFVGDITASDWMDNSTKFYAVEKARSMGVNMAYPDWMMSNGRPNEPALLDYYKNVQIGDASHFQNILNLYNLEVRDDAQLLRKAPNKNIWITKPAVINAFYSPAMNAIFFPAGFLQAPFYYLGLPIRAINFGGIGSVIGHEIIHGFDDSGSLYDKDGSRRNWWTNSTKAEYDEKAECFVGQYDNIRVFGLPDTADCSDLKVNGKLTLGENLADNGGFRSAYEAFVAEEARSPTQLRLPGLSQYDQNQLFFISHATGFCGIATKDGLVEDLVSDSHAPWPTRIVGVYRNMPEFAEAFGCVPRDEMDPVDKCELW